VQVCITDYHGPSIDLGLVSVHHMCNVYVYIYVYVGALTGYNFL